MDLEKEYTCQEGVLLVNCVQNYDWSSAAFVNRSLLGILNFRESHKLSVPGACTVLLPPEPHPYNRITGIRLSPTGWESVPSNQNHTVISLFTYLLTNLSSPIMTNQNRLFWPIMTVPFGPIRLYKFGFLICIKMDKSGTRAGTFPIKSGLPFFSIKIGLPFVSVECIFRSCVSPVCKLLIWKVSPLSAPQIGGSCWH